MRQEAEVGPEQGGSRNFLFLASPGFANLLPTPRHPLPGQGRRPLQIPRVDRGSSPSGPRAASRGPPHLVSVTQGARAGLPAGPAGPRRLQAALPRGRGPGRLPRALRPMVLGPEAPTLSVPGTLSRRGSRWRRPRQAGGRAPMGARAADTHVEGGR
jgi:hypothetical protein